MRIDVSRVPVRVVAQGILLVIAAAILLVPGVTRDSRFSIYDEATHLDNSWRYANFDIPQVGERVSPEILSEWTCRGFYDSDVDFPACTPATEVMNETFPFSLSNYNTKHPPLYYAVNGFVARIVVWSTPVDSFVTAARLANSVWLALTVVSVILIAQLLRLSRSRSWLLAALAVGVPVAFGGWFYVNNDVGSYASAWLVAYAALRIREVGIREGWMLLLVAGVAGSLTKGFTVAAVGIGVLLIIPMLGRAELRSKKWRNEALRLIAVLAASGSTVVGWIVFNRAYKSDIEYVPVIIRPPLEGIPWQAISDQVVRFTFPIGAFPGWMSAGSVFVDHGLFLWVLGAMAICSAVPVALAIGIDFERARAAERWLGFVAFVSSPLLATMIIAFNLLDGSPGFVRIIDRYHLSVIPFWLIALGTVLSVRRPATRAIAALLSAGLAAEFLIYLSVAL